MTNRAEHPPSACGCRAEEFRTVLCEEHWQTFSAWIEGPPDLAPKLREYALNARVFVREDGRAERFMDDESFLASLGEYEALAKSESEEDHQIARSLARRSIRRGLDQAARGETVRRDDLMDEA